MTSDLITLCDDCLQTVNNQGMEIPVLSQGTTMDSPCELCCRSWAWQIVNVCFRAKVIEVVERLLDRVKK